MNDRENTAVGAYWLIWTATFAFCAIGAFVLPPQLLFNKWLGCFALAGFFIGIPVMLRAADRSRIRDAVRQLGGELIRLTPIQEWDPYRVRMRGKKFEVVYVDPSGSTHRALCRTGFIQGVRWLEDAVVTPDYLDAPSAD